VKLSHYLLGSFAAYYITGSFFGAITLTYAMRMVDLNQSRVYSWCWVLVSVACLKAGTVILGGLALALAIAGGYWPLVLYSLPFTYKALPFALPFIIPQLIVTYFYMRTSVRALKKKPEVQNSSIPPIHVLSLIYRLDINMRGQLWPELSYAVGPIVLLCALYSGNLLLAALAIFAVLLMVGCIPTLGRIPARAAYLLTMAIVLMASESYLLLPPKVALLFLVFQIFFILIHHEEVLIPIPFAEPAKRPSDAFKLPEDAPRGIIANLPYPTFTGYLSGVRGIPYHGGCMSLINYNLLKLDDPDGDGSHDFPLYPGVTHRYDRGKYVPV